MTCAALLSSGAYCTRPHGHYGNHEHERQEHRCPTCLTLLARPDAACVLGPHPVCEVCGDVYSADEGCQHDGHSRCASCLDACSECRDAINDYVRD